MRWPWKKTEQRQSGGDFSDVVVRLLESQAAGTVADASSTAAVEAVSGLLSRAFSDAKIDGASWVQDAVTPSFLGQVGRDLVRSGDSLHVVQVRERVQLIPASSWHWEGNHDPDSWTCRVTAYGPSTSTTWNLPARSIVFVRWGSTPGQTYVGTGPLSWASTTARLQSQIERSLADEAQGPLAQLIAIPQNETDPKDDIDPLAPLKSSIAGARGKALLVETVNAGWGEGKAASPQRDWQANRLGPTPPAPFVEAAKQSFQRVIAACGASPALFDDSDGTSKREALRQWHLGTVRPLARLLETELTMKLDAPVKLVFDNYPLDLAGRAQAFQKLVAGGADPQKAMILSGLLDQDEE